MAAVPHAVAGVLKIRAYSPVAELTIAASVKFTPRFDAPGTVSMFGVDVP